MANDDPLFCHSHHIICDTNVLKQMRWITPDQIIWLLEDTVIKKMPLRVTLFKSPERNLKTNCLLFLLLLLLTHRVYQKQSNGILQNSKIWCISSCAPSFFLFGEDQPHIWWKGWYQRGIGSNIEKILRLYCK